jgi:hypothetical protein
MLLRGGPYTIEDLRSLGITLTEDGIKQYQEPEFAEFAEAQIRLRLSVSEGSLSAALATGNDYSLKYANWTINGDHDF